MWAFDVKIINPSDKILEFLQKEYGGHRFSVDIPESQIDIYRFMEFFRKKCLAIDQFATLSFLAEAGKKWVSLQVDGVQEHWLCGKEKNGKAYQDYHRLLGPAETLKDGAQTWCVYGKAVLPFDIVLERRNIDSCLRYLESGGSRAVLMALMKYRLVDLSEIEEENLKAVIALR